MDDQHGRCPHCDADMNGGSIWAHFLDETGGDPEEADFIAAMYGATREKGRWGRQIGITPVGHDRVTDWQCPDCGGQWPRT